MNIVTPAELEHIGYGETLIDLAQVLRGRSLIVACEGCSTEHELSVVKLALDFSRLPKVTQLRAIVEGWDGPKIVKETY